MPKYRKWTRYARQKGYVQLPGGPGDHSKWESPDNGRKVQINKKGDELDIASVKALTRIEKKTLRQLAIEISNS